MHFSPITEETMKHSSFLQLQAEVNESKVQKAVQEIQSLERIWANWLSNQHGSNEDFTKKNETIEVECSQETDAVEKNQQLKKFFEGLKERMVDQKLYSALTSSQLSQFFEEATTQIQNKIKLFEDIQKLKLLSSYPTNTKRTYSKQANMILKKWLIENYNNPYPKPAQIEQLVQQTSLTNKQVLNWFINARNSLKNKSLQEKKFKHIVECKFKELAATKKRKIEHQSQ